MTRRRLPGQGTIELLPSGRYRARVVLPDGIRHDLGTFASYEEAEGVIVATVDEAIAAGIGPTNGVTLRGWGARHLDARELAGYVGMSTLRSIWRKHVEPQHWTEWPLKRVTAMQLRRWLTDKAKDPELSDSYLRQMLGAVRGALESAMLEGYLDSNVATSVRVPKRDAPTEESWTYLQPHEQRRITTLGTIPEEWRLAIGFAIWTGIRVREQWCLHLRDVHLGGDEPHIVVRYGSVKGGKLRAPKGRRIRTVPLMGEAVPIARRWLELSKARNPRGLMWPGPGGGFRKGSDFPTLEGESLWPQWIRSAGIDRYVRWHDLRHTCGSSLVSGWWGRAWRLEEVRDLLGHKSIEETERYAHLGDTVLRRAAAETRGMSTLGIGLPNNRTIQSSCRTFGVSEGSLSRPVEGRGVTPRSGHASTHDLAARVLVAIEMRDPFLLDRVMDLTQLVLDLKDASSAEASSRLPSNPHPLTHRPRRKSQ